MDRQLPRKTVRLMLLGRTGAGKTSAVNTILPHGLCLDTPEDLRRSVRRIGERNFKYECYNISIVDTPDWLSPVMSGDDVIADIVRCCSLSAPGPHAFLLVVPLTEPSQEDQRWIKVIMGIFGMGALNYIMILFTHSGTVSDSIDQLIAEGNEVLRDLVVTCGNRFHKFNNEITNSDAQVKTMLYKVQNMVRGNGSTFYCGHSRASVFLSKMGEETRREVVETMRGGQGEGCRSRGLFTFCENALVAKVKEEEMERGIGWPGQEEVKREDTEQRNWSEEANHGERTNGQEEENETEQARDEKAKEEVEKGQVTPAEEEMGKRREEREEMMERNKSTEELGTVGHMKSDGAQEKSRKEEKKRKMVEGAMAEKKKEEKRRKMVEGEIAEKKKKEKKRKMVLVEGAIAEKKKKEKKRKMFLVEGAIAEKKKKEKEGRSSLKEAETMKKGKKKMKLIVTEEVEVKQQKKRKKNQEEDKSEGHSEQKESRGKKQRTVRVNVEEEQPGPSYQFTPVQRKKVQKPTYFSPLKKGEKADIWTWDIYKSQLLVTCGDKTGMLSRDKLAKGTKCITADDQWFTPGEFEKYGGRESSKNWKSSIKCQGTAVGKLIKDGHLSTPGYTKRKTQNTEDRCHSSPRVAKISSKGKTKAKRVLFTNETSVTDEEEEDAEQEPDRGNGNNDETVFKVTCGAIPGMLHKCRFASGLCGKSIRTEDSWMTPVEFVKQGSAEPDASWKKDIQWEGKPLGVLIEKEVLKPHSVLCDCTICSSESLEDHRNDDECFVCRGEGEEDLVVCEQCPRAFHQLCHLPYVEDALLGDGNPWICTFCVFEASKHWRYPQQLTQKTALVLQMADHLLECQYLLLSLYSAVKDKISATNPGLNMRGYTALIKTPMDKIAEKLQQNYFQTVGQFVSDVLLIFTNSATFNRDTTDVQTMGVKLKVLFESEFQKVFSIQQ